MTNQNKVRKWMKEQVGTEEHPKGSNNVVYNTDYYGYPVSGDAYPWCCAFIWDGFYQTGLSRLFCGGQKTAYCPFVVNYAKAHNQWVKGNYQPGDLVLYDWNGDGVADHIGFVLNAVGSSVTVIEGNCENAVTQLTRSEVGIMGAYRPVYDEDSKSDTYTVQEGDTLASIAKKHSMTLARLVELNPCIKAGDVLKVDSIPDATEDTVIADLAIAVIRGEFGVGEERRRLLGDRYDAVQNKVNEILRG